MTAQERAELKRLTDRMVASLLPSEQARLAALMVSRPHPEERKKKAFDKFVNFITLEWLV